MDLNRNWAVNWGHKEKVRATPGMPCWLLEQAAPARPGQSPKRRVFHEGRRGASLGCPLLLAVGGARKPQCLVAGRGVDLWQKNDIQGEGDCGNGSWQDSSLVRRTGV